MWDGEGARNALLENEESHGCSALQLLIFGCTKDPWAAVGRSWCIHSTAVHRPAAANVGLMSPGLPLRFQNPVIVVGTFEDGWG